MCYFYQHNLVLVQPSTSDQAAWGNWPSDQPINKVAIKDQFRAFGTKYVT